MRVVAHCTHAGSYQPNPQATQHRAAFVSEGETNVHYCL